MYCSFVLSYKDRESYVPGIKFLDSLYLSVLVECYVKNVGALVLCLV